MTAAISRLSRPSRELVGGAVLSLVAIVIGVVAGHSPGLGIAAAAGVLFALILLSDLAVGLCLFLLVAFLDVVSLNQDLSVTKGAGAVLAVSWLAMIATRRGSERQGLASQSPWLAGALIGLLAWSALSAMWAESFGAVVRSTERFGLVVLLVPIVYAAVRERKHVVWLFGVFVVGALLSVLWGLTQGKLAGGAAAAQAGRLSGATVEANVLAALLIVCVIFSGALALVARRAPLVRGLAVLAGAAATLAFFATYSRGGLVALGVVIAAGCVYAGRWRRPFVALALGVVLVGAVLVQSTGSGAVNRLTSTTSSGRTDIWRLSLRMVGAHPVVGVGSGNFNVAEPHYLLSSPGEIQAVNFVLTDPQPTHNTYLQTLAEMGVVGLALFLLILLLSIRAAVLAVRIFHARGDRSMEILARALVLAIVGILAADFFVSDSYSKQLWLLLAVCPALLAIARRSPMRRRDAAESPMAPHGVAASDPEWRP